MGKVTIRRDDWGVPHVSAETEADVFFANGYAQAEDNFPRIAEHYLAVHGRLASVRGAEALPTDLLARRWRALEESRAGFQRLEPALQDNYRAFMDGIQRWADEHPDEVPEWMPELEPALAIGYLRMALFAYAYREAAAKLAAAGVGANGSAVPEQAEALRQRLSNQWVLMPWRTEQGATVLLSDPHGGIDELRMFEIAMDAPGFKSVGACVVGNPLPILGHTEKVAWALTTGNPDVSDAYRVECDPNDLRRYAIDGDWHDMETSTETIEVAGGDSIEVTLEYTRHNDVLCPVVHRDGNVAWVISSPYMHVPELQDEQLYRWQHAKDVHEFRAAMETNGNFSQNVMAADSSGNTFYVRGGRTPIRPDGVDHTQVLDGNTSKTLWEGIHPLDDLVQIVNPTSGYMQNCNIAPDQMMLDTTGTSLQPDNYRAYVYGDQPGRFNTRGRRANELLSRCFNASVEEALEIALDEQWLYVPNWQAALRHAVEQDPAVLRDAPDAARHLAHHILAFDGRAAADSIGATAYWYWRTGLGVLEDVEVAELRTLIDQVNDELGETTTQPLSAAHQRLLLRALQEAATALVERAGRVDVPFGELFRMGRGGRSWPGRSAAIVERTILPDDNGITSGPVVMPLRVMMYGPPDERGQRWPLLGGRSLRLVSFTDPITSYSVILFGQSGREDSPHHADQCQLFSERRVRSTYFDDDELAAHTVSSMTLER